MWSIGSTARRRPRTSTRRPDGASAYGTVTGPTPNAENGNRAKPQVIVEPMTGIEPAYSAWEADVLPLNYIGEIAVTSTNADHSRPI
jgi:hypothetical protein